MKKGYELLSRLDGASKLPLEYAAGLPRITLEGYHTLRVEAHRGVLEYGEERIDLAAAGAVLRISGSGLSLRALSMEQAVVTGRIAALELLYEEAAP